MCETAAAVGAQYTSAEAVVNDRQFARAEARAAGMEKPAPADQGGQ